ncbi:hypothetical protein WAI453_012433 [Rhynchosporium graminicola]
MLPSRMHKQHASIFTMIFLISAASLVFSTQVLYPAELLWSVKNNHIRTATTEHNSHHISSSHDDEDDDDDNNNNNNIYIQPGTRKSQTPTPAPAPAPASPNSRSGSEGREMFFKCTYGIVLRRAGLVWSGLVWSGLMYGGDKIVEEDWTLVTSWRPGKTLHADGDPCR